MEIKRMIKLTKLLHSAILVSDLTQSIEFYEGLLGLQADFNRPDLGYPGRWYQLSEQQIHLMQLPDVEKVNGNQLDRPEHVGRDKHFALEVDSVENLAKLLESKKIIFTMSRSGRKALFCRDPDGNGLEFVQLN
jgi:glyoxylase I family protein